MCRKMRGGGACWWWRCLLVVVGCAGLVAAPRCPVGGSRQNMRIGCAHPRININLSASYQPIRECASHLRVPIAMRSLRYCLTNARLVFLSMTPQSSRIRSLYHLSFLPLVRGQYEVTGYAGVAIIGAVCFVGGANIGPMLGFRCVAAGDCPVVTVDTTFVNEAAHENEIKTRCA